jgi:hypothetical protein
MKDRFKFLQDESGHWYCMSEHDASAVNASLESCQNIEDEEGRELAIDGVWDTVSGNRCAGGPESYTFTSPIDSI